MLRWNNLWQKAVGGSDQFGPEGRSINAVILITFGVVLVYLLAAVSTGIPHVTIFLSVLTATLGGLYYLSRVRGQVQLSIVTFAFLSYVTLVCNYYFNAGIDGPTLLLFFITYNLLIAVTAPRLHPLWAILHIAVAAIVVAFEYYNPQFIPASFPTRADRFWDVLSTYVISLGFVYLITSYLRRSLARERKLTEAHARKIEVQNRRISIQNQKLEAVLRERDKLFSIVSHDMLGPLGSIQSYLELVTEAPELDEMEMKKEMLNLTKHTSGMLRNILVWSKAQIQGISIQFSDVRLNGIVRQVLAVQQSIASMKDISVVFDPKEDVVAVADADILQLIIRNIISNAIKFTPAQGTVTIELARKGDECLIAVRDTGLGMSPEHLSGLFTAETKPTYGTANEKGVGLGLSMCGEFIKRLNGRIDVQSTPGEGSCFAVYVPAASATLAE